MTNQPDIDAQQIAECVTRFRGRKPHVHCITNSVAQHFTANVLLAAGATPSMTIAVEEIGDFVSMADALLVNLGTMDKARNEAVNKAVETAGSQSKPWVLDPVFVQASPLRLKLAQTLLAKSPTLVRCNANEGKALFGILLNADTVAPCARDHKTTIAMTGRVDTIGNNAGSISLCNGSQQMDRITAMGCALTALIAGFLATEDNTVLATASAISLFGIAGENAEDASDGPGTFVPAFLDALHNLNPKEIETGVVFA